LKLKVLTCFIDVFQSFFMSNQLPAIRHLGFKFSAQPTSTVLGSKWLASLQSSGETRSCHMPGRALPQDPGLSGVRRMFQLITWICLRWLKDGPNK
jgi:hypothetical protein